jgi:hypothetical protein
MTPVAAQTKISALSTSGICILNSAFDIERLLFVMPILLNADQSRPALKRWINSPK